MLPTGYEGKLLTLQHQKRISLFGCDDFTIYSNKVVVLAPGVQTSVVDSDLKCDYGGEFGTALNLDIFFIVWKKVSDEKRFSLHDWTVKVDPDCVFLPARLRVSLGARYPHGPNGANSKENNGVYVNNCKFGLHGPLEVLSRDAVNAWLGGSKRCVDHFTKLCSGDCLWGEDMFMDQCLKRVVVSKRIEDYDVLLEDHCDPPDDWKYCKDSKASAFHPFKTVDSYKGCLANLTGAN